MKYFRILILTLAVYLTRYDLKMVIVLGILLYLFKKFTLEMKISISIGIILILFSYIRAKMVIPEGDYLFRTEVVNVVNNNLIVKYKNTRILIYTDEQLMPGDIIIIEGEILIPNGSDIENGFNYRNCLLSQEISNVMYNPKIKYEKHIFHMNIIPFQIKKMFKTKYESQSYIDALIFGEKLSTDVASNVQSLGINHMFAISGLHINIIATGLGKLLLKITGKKQEKIISSFLIFYMFLTNFSVSVVRASLLYIIPNVYRKKEISNLSILSILALLLLIYNPFIIYNSAFVFSFFVSFILVLSSSITTSKSKLKQAFLPLITIFFFTLPLTCYYSYEVNLLSIIYNLVFGFIVMCVLLPLCMLTLALPFFIYVLDYIVQGFNVLLDIANILNLKVVIGKPSIYLILLYYLVLLQFCIDIETFTFNRKRYIDLSIVTILMLSSTKLAISSEVTFLSVGQADSILIRSNINNCNALIDLGETSTSNNLERKIVPLLKSKGITKLDSVILTHDHYDHYGQFKRLDSFIKTESIYVNKYSKINGINRVSEGDVIRCGKLKFEVLSPRYNTTTNSNSIVLYVNINNVGFLFTGDIEYTAERYLDLSKYKVDVLKVSHHGSITSTSEEFLKQINPKIGVLSTGLNYYGHPDKIILNRLLNYGVKCYDTNVDGSIKVEVLSGKYKITNYKKK